MGLLVAAKNEQAFLKAGLLGFPGSGKSYTTSMLAIGIAKGIANGKPVAWFDTETGSDFLIPKFDAEGVPLLRLKSSAFADLMEVGKEAESACSVLIVDSITHVWRELVDAYQRKRNIRRMEFQHWGDVKREWARWTSFFLNSRLHILVCGRAGYEYDNEIDEDGKKSLVKAGTKMKVESEFGFEPSLVIEMERVARDEDPNAAKTGKAKRAIGGAWMHRAHVLKDRTDTLNGEYFDFGKLTEQYQPGDYAQVFRVFAPVFAVMNIGGAHVGLDTSRTSDEVFDAHGESQARARVTRLKVALETIEQTIVLLWPGQDAKTKQIKVAALEAVFGTRSWTAVEKSSVEDLERGVEMLQRIEAAINGGTVIADAGALVALVEMFRQQDADAAAVAAESMVV